LLKKKPDPNLRFVDQISSNTEKKKPHPPKAPPELLNLQRREFPVKVKGLASNGNRVDTKGKGTENEQTPPLLKTIFDKTNNLHRASCQACRSPGWVRASQHHQSGKLKKKVCRKQMSYCQTDLEDCTVHSTKSPVKQCVAEGVRLERSSGQASKTTRAKQRLGH